MYCMKCGKPMDDSADICPSCGAKVDREQVNAAIQAHMAREQGPVYDKPSKAPIIALIVVAVLLLAGAGGVFFWMNRPINKVNKAIENNDIETVNEYCDDLSEEDRTDVEAKMLIYATDICNDYIDGKRDYDDADSELSTLKKGILKGNAEFDKLVIRVGEIKQSRDDFDTANKAFDEEDYSKALDYYAKVIKDDTNYETAQAKIKECESKLTPDVKGEWVCTVDVGNAILKEIGLTTSEKEFSFPINIVFDFTDDENGRMYVDKEGIKEHMGEFVEIAMEELLRQYELNFGLTEADLDKMFKLYYGTTLRGYFDQLLDDDTLFEAYDIESEIKFTYTVESNKVTIDSENDYQTKLEIKDDTLEMNDLDLDSYVGLTELGIQPPLVFERK